MFFFLNLCLQSDGLDSACCDSTVNGHLPSNAERTLDLQGIEDSLADGEFDYGDLDDDIDPAMKEKIDR